MASTTYLLVTFLTLLVLCYFFPRKRYKSVPPGPKGRFLVGNLSALMLEGTERAKTYVKWFEDYGTQ